MPDENSAEDSGPAYEGKAELFVEAGEVLKKMRDGKLWRVGGFKTWEDYCRSVLGMSRIRAHRLMQASQCVIGLRAESDLMVKPVSEYQVRPLLKLKNHEDRRYAWDAAVMFAEDTKSNAKPTARDVNDMVVALLGDDLD